MSITISFAGHLNLDLLTTAVLYKITPTGESGDAQLFNEDTYFKHLVQTTIMALQAANEVDFSSLFSSTSDTEDNNDVACTISSSR